MARTMPWRSAGPPQEGLAPEASLVLESKKGLRSKRTIWGPQRRALGDPPQTALPPMDEEGWHSSVESGAFFILDKMRSQRTHSRGCVNLRMTAMSGVGNGA